MIKKTLKPKYNEEDKVEFYCDSELAQENPPTYKGEIILIISNESKGYKYDKYTYVIDNHNCAKCLKNIEPISKTIQVFEKHVKGLIKQ